MKIFITGAGGFLGKRLVNSLLINGCTDLVLGIRQAKSVEPLRAIAASYPNAKIELVNANLMNKGQLKGIFKNVDVLIHAAAGMKGAPADMYMNSVIASRNLLDEACAAGVKKMVLISSFAVYKTNDLAIDAVMDEATPIEDVGIEKGVYAYTKVQQERLFLEYKAKFNFSSVIIRPGVIFGPGGPGLSTRVGIGAGNLFASMGGRAPLPLTYVDNCADAIALAAMVDIKETALNVVDDNIPTCNEFLKLYRERTEKIKVLRVPYLLLHTGSKILARYHKYSKGQLPAVLTPYIVKSMFRPLKYPNTRLKSLGWTPKVCMTEGLKMTLVPKAT